jgi:hypothetical protein
MARPTNGPGFAEGGANPSTWPSAKAANGYAANEKLPAEDFNGILENHGAWIDYLSRGGAFTSPRLAAETLAAGESAVVAPRGAAYVAAPFDQYDSALTGQVTAVAADAERIYVATNIGGTGAIHALPSDATNFTTDIEWTTTAGAAVGLVAKMVTNGTYLAALILDSGGAAAWSVFDVTDGTLAPQFLTTTTVGRTGADIAISENYLVVVGEAAASGDWAADVTDLSDGSRVDALPWGTSLDAFCVCALEGDRFFIAAEADGSSNQIGTFDASNLGAGYERATVTRAIVSGASCCSDGRRVYLHNGPTSGYVTAWNLDLVAVWETAKTITGPPHLVCDAKDVWLAEDNGTEVAFLHTLDPVTGAILRTSSISGDRQTTTASCPPVAANSWAVYAGITNNNGGVDLPALAVFNSGLRSRRWTKEPGPPHFTQAQPEVL